MIESCSRRQFIQYLICVIGGLFTGDRDGEDSTPEPDSDRDSGAGDELVAGYGIGGYGEQGYGH